MDQLIEISTASWSTWLLVSARFFGAMLVLPLFSENTIPLRFKFGFAFQICIPKIQIWDLKSEIRIPDVHTQTLHFKSEI